MLPLAIRLPLLRFSRLSVGPVLIILAFRALIAHVAPVVVLLLVLAPHCLALRMKLQALAAAAMAQASMASPILLVILVKRASAWALPVVARVVVVVVVLVLVLVLEYWSDLRLKRLRYRSSKHVSRPIGRQLSAIHAGNKGVQEGNR
jgi:hypothetical protein